MDFTIAPHIERMRVQIAQFVDTRLIPLEADPASYDEHENIRHDLLQVLRQETRAMGIWALQSKPSRGGGGLSMANQAVLYEEMNRSIFGPVCFNCSAPDDGNMRVLEQAATEAQKDRWLQPIIDGAVQSSFVMTEPMDEDGAGCGSDPSLTNTTATRTNTGWVIKGRKWFITGAATAAHFILIARTSDDARKGVSMAKIVVADALHRAADTALQLLGAQGYSKDTVVEWIYRYARQARLVDGASEVHRMVLAQTMRKEGRDFHSWDVAHDG